MEKENQFKLNLKKLRVRNNLSQGELATLLHVKQYVISSWEIGRSEPNIDYIIQLSQIFKVPCDYLLGNDNLNDNEQTQNLINNLKRDYEDEDIEEIEKIFKNLTQEQKKLIVEFVRSASNIVNK